MARIDMRVPDWLKRSATVKSGGNLSGYIKQLMIDDLRQNPIQNKVKRVPLIKRV